MTPGTGQRRIDLARLRPMLTAMSKLFSGLFGFSICLFLGIVFEQVAIGILVGLFLGAFFGSRNAKGEAAPGETEPTRPE